MAHIAAQHYDYILVLDFEATCDDKNRSFPNEIIEFPIVALDARTGAIVDEFREYVKPQINPVLTSFCTKLTGIQQETVDSAQNFVPVFNRAQEWCARFLNTSGGPAKTCFLTCGDWDLKTMLPKQAALSNVTIPAYMKQWINVKRPFNSFTGRSDNRVGMDGMLAALKLPLVGRHHSGLDDARNIAAIAWHLMQKGVELESFVSTSSA